MDQVDSPSSVYSQSIDGGSPRHSSASPYRDQVEDIQRLAARNLQEYARLRRDLDDLSHRVDALDFPSLSDRLDLVNARTYELGFRLNSGACQVETAGETAPLTRCFTPPPRSSSLPTGVLYVPSSSSGPPAAGRVQRLARERGLRMLRTSDATSALPSSYRLARQRPRPSLLANE